MRAFSAIVVILFIFTACHRQQVTMPDVARTVAPMVIDYPAGVMIDGSKQVTAPGKRNISFAEKILSPHQIPLLDTVTNRMVFVKRNGDRISVDIDKLSGKYDIILFNAVNNPVPLRMADLQVAMNQIFNFKKNTIQTFRDLQKAGNKPVQSDTIVKPSLRNRLSGLKNRDKRIVVSTDDGEIQKLTSRHIPGVQWIEQKSDTRSILTLHFENDLITYANTDRYFTNGITIDLQSARIGHSVIEKLMIPYKHEAFVTYHLLMVQDMYTPTDTRIAPALKKDRPYSSYLYFGYRKTTADGVRKLKITSQLDAGYIGPYSPGSYMQTLVHKTFPTNDVPLGWETQIKTDVILNYSIKLEKAFVHTEHISLLAGLDVKAGTLYNQTGAGVEIRAGKHEPMFGLAQNSTWPATEYYFFAKTHAGFVAYNALLQGGFFNNSNIFTLKGSEIQRVVGNAEAGFRVRYKGIGMELAQHYLSPEYKGGLWHKWGRISLFFRI